MIEGIGNKEFNFYLERYHAELKSYPWATAKELKHNIQLPIQIDKPDIVVIYDRCNDIRPEKSIPKKFWCHKRSLTEFPTFDPIFQRYCIPEVYSRTGTRYVFFYISMFVVSVMNE